MPTVVNLKQELTDATTLKFISRSFVETSAAKLKTIRKIVDNNRQFYFEISQIFDLVKLYAIKKKIYPKLFRSATVNTLLVAVTSNQHFYGEINIAVMETFIRQTAKLQGDILTIGSTGVDYLKSLNYDKPYQTHLFLKDFPNASEIKSFLGKIAPYNQVILYYPKFVSLLSQTVSSTDITQTMSSDTGKKVEIGIIFEPELPKILDFFQKQVRSVLFLKVMLETDLSRTAARLMSMSNAEERADKLILEKRIELKKSIRSIINTQLLETFAGITKWKR